METRLVIFLGFIFIALATNTLLIWLVYKAFLGVTTKLTETVTEFERSGSTRDLLNSLQTAAQQAADVTQTTKERMTELDPMLERTQQKYALALAAADSRMEHAAEQVANGAEKVRDAVAKPAVSIMSFMAGLSSAVASEDEE